MTSVTAHKTAIGFAMRKALKTKRFVLWTTRNGQFFTPPVTIAETLFAIRIHFRSRSRRRRRKKLTGMERVLGKAERRTELRLGKEQQPDKEPGLGKVIVAVVPAGYECGPEKGGRGGAAGGLRTATGLAAPSTPASSRKTSRAKCSVVLNGV